jgi:hypothetical protein
MGVVMSEPLRILSLGAGVQSSTVLYMSCIGQLPKLDAAIFADTQDEPRAVYEHLNWLEEFAAEYAVPIYRVTKGPLHDAVLHAKVSSTGLRYDSLPFFTINANGDYGLAHRNCTTTYKVEVIHQQIRALAGIKSGSRSTAALVEQWFGISADEAQRMRTPHFSWMRHRYPLIYDRRMTRQHCIAWLIEHGFPRPPRSACIFCPYRTDAEWRDIKANPTEWAAVLAFDHALRALDNGRQQLFLHAQRIPLDQVDFSTAEERGQLSLFHNDCEGMCGV